MMPIKVSRLGDPDKVALVLLHGWACPATVWQPLLDQLCENFHVHLVSLPGYGADDDLPSRDAWQPESLMQSFNAAIPDRAIWCGWSLGGMLATYYAASVPERVKGLITIASNPVFVAQSDWSEGMEQQTFRMFAKGVSKQTKATLNRFMGLVTQGAPTARADLRQLRTLLAVNSIDPAVLLDSLDLLGCLDVREEIRHLEIPQLHLLGERDGLVPAGAASLIGKLNAGAEIRVMPDASHIPWLAQAEDLISTVHLFCEKYGILNAD